MTTNENINFEANNISTTFDITGSMWRGRAVVLQIIKSCLFVPGDDPGQFPYVWKGRARYRKIDNVFFQNRGGSSRTVAADLIDISALYISPSSTLVNEKL